MAKLVMNKIAAAYQNISFKLGFSLESGDSQIGLAESRPSLIPRTYFDDPSQEPSQDPPRHFDHVTLEGSQPLQHISPSTGEACPLKVQSTSFGAPLQPAGSWIRLNVSGHPPQSLRLSAWVTGEGYHYTHPAYRVLACLATLIKAILLSPAYGYLVWRYASADVRTRPALHARSRQISHEYPKFVGRCSEYPKHARSNFDVSSANPRTHSGNDNVHFAPMYAAKEQERLYRPRKLFVKDGDSWVEMDGDGLQMEKPYLFVSYAANQFQRSEDSSGRLVLTEGASQRVKERAIVVTEQNGLDAFWIDFLRAPNQPEATDDVHRFCDVVRGSELVCILLAEDKDMANSLAMFGKRLWCLPECLLAPKHTVLVQGGGISEMISIINLPARAWTHSYINDSGQLVQGKGKKEEFRLLAEHYSTPFLSRLQLFSVALSAMRALDFFPFQKGDIAYALMGLLCKRPAMDPTDSERQALARVCLSNDNDRLLERIVCVLPSKDNVQSGWLTTNDSFGINLWDIEPRCQVAGICNDDAIIIDGCHGITIGWESIPQIDFKTQKTASQKLVLSVLWSSGLFLFYGVFFVLILVYLVFLSIYVSYIPDGALNSLIKILWWCIKVSTSLYLSLGFIAPFCLRWIYSGSLAEISPHLIGIEGSMPIDQLERLVFGTVAGHGRLRYSASSTIPHSQGNTQMHRSERMPTIDPQSIPAGHTVFTLLDTVSSLEDNVNSISARTDYSQGTSTVTVFTATKPPTVALLCGTESGFLRAVLCSYNAGGKCLHTETVLRMETSKWESSATLGWVKLAMS